MQDQINSFQWVSQKPETRQKLREIFYVPRSSHSEVVTDSMGHGMVTSDGTTNTDLLALTVEKMRDYLGTAAVNETVYDLFKRCVDKIEEKEVKPIIEFSPDVEQKIFEKENQSELKCPECAYSSASKQGMRMHIYAKHTRIRDKK